MQAEPRLEKGLLGRVREAAELLRDRGRRDAPVRVVAHVDTDGQTSGAIIAKALTRIGVGFQVRVVQQLDEESLRDANSGDPKLIVLTDLGSGNLTLLTKALRGRSILVIDHHQVIGDEEVSETLVHVNPRLFGVSGEKELSASGTAYLVAKTMDAENLDLSAVAVVGALGDLQDRNPERALTGMNKAIVQDAVESGLLRTDVDLLLFGRETRPLQSALANTTNPFLPGLSGEEDQCVALLTQLSIPLKEGDRWRVLGDLAQDEKKALFNGIIAFLVSRGFPASGSAGLIGTVYTLVREDRLTPLRDGRELSSLLNACGRAGKHGLGVALAMGDRSKPSLEEAYQVLAEYRKTIAEALRLLTGSRDRVRELNAVYWINGENTISDRMISSVLSLFAAAPVFSSPKPLIATAVMEGGKLKVSARGSDPLLARGLNLGVALAEASSKVGGIGGGHRVAAGAVIPVEKRDDFLTLVDAAVAAQMEAGSLGSSGDQG
ncbi:MAG: DHH family phosphoesterase [Candidatus Bathyarchaeia archaeon]